MLVGTSSLNTNTICIAGSNILTVGGFWPIWFKSACEIDQAGVLSVLFPIYEIHFLCFFKPQIFTCYKLLPWADGMITAAYLLSGSSFSCQIVIFVFLSAIFNHTILPSFSVMHSFGLNRVGTGRVSTTRRAVFYHLGDIIGVADLSGGFAVIYLRWSERWHFHKEAEIVLILSLRLISSLPFGSCWCWQ